MEEAVSLLSLADEFASIRDSAPVTPIRNGPSPLGVPAVDAGAGAPTSPAPRGSPAPDVPRVKLIDSGDLRGASGSPAAAADGATSGSLGEYGYAVDDAVGSGEGAGKSARVRGASPA